MKQVWLNKTLLYSINAFSTGVPFKTTQGHPTHLLDGKARHAFIARSPGRPVARAILYQPKAGLLTGQGSQKKPHSLCGYAAAFLQLSIYLYLTQGCPGELPLAAAPRAAPPRTAARPCLAWRAVAGSRSAGLRS